jgi:hypothetical protein
MSHATKPTHCVAAVTPVAARSPLRWIPNWLPPGWSHLPGHRPRPAAGGAANNVACVVARHVEVLDHLGPDLEPRIRT